MFCGNGVGLADQVLSCVIEAIEDGSVKVNVCTEIRQPYEVALRETNDIAKAQQACYERTRWVIADYFGIAGTRARVAP